MIKKFQQFNEGERYQDILKGYGKDMDDIKSKRNTMSDKATGRFEHIPSNDLAEELLEKYYKTGFKLLDIGCGMGNILKLGNAIGYDSYGIEVNHKLRKYHDGLKVIYGDILNLPDYKFLKKFDVVYLYRPIEPLDKCNDLFEILHKHCKEGCKIIYVLSSQLELNLKRKFEFELFTIKETGQLTDRPYDRKHENFYSILTPIKTVKDINVKSILNKIFEYLSKYRWTKDKDIKNERYGSRFICDDVNMLNDFISNIKKSYNLIKINNLDIKFKHSVTVKFSETEESYNKTKTEFSNKFIPSPQKGSLYSAISKLHDIDTITQGKDMIGLDIIESIEYDLKKMENYKLEFVQLSVDMSYSKIDNEYYQKIGYFGN